MRYASTTEYGHTLLGPLVYVCVLHIEFKYECVPSNYLQTAHKIRT